MLSKKTKKTLYKLSLNDEIQKLAHHLKYLLHHKKLVPVLIPIRDHKYKPQR